MNRVHSVGGKWLARIQAIGFSLAFALTLVAMPAMANQDVIDALEEAGLEVSEEDRDEILETTPETLSIVMGRVVNRAVGINPEAAPDVARNIANAVPEQAQTAAVAATRAAPAQAVEVTTAAVESNPDRAAAIAGAVSVEVPEAAVEVAVAAATAAPEREAEVRSAVRGNAPTRSQEIDAAVEEAL